jgi:hypothetical protein
MRTIPRMTIEQLRKLHAARPFQPFDIHLADSRTLTVEHPEFLAQSAGGRTIAVGQPDGTIEIVDLLLVVSLEAHANGVRRRGRARSERPMLQSLSLLPLPISREPSPHIPHPC